MILAIDTETTGTDFFHGCRPFMITMCDGKFNYLFIGQVNPYNREVTWNPQDISQAISLITSATKIVMHNAAFDIRALSTIGINPSLIFPKLEDTLIASHLLCSSDEHGLKELAIKYLQYWDDDEQYLQQQIVSLRLNSSYDIAKEGHPHFPAVRNAIWWKQDMWLDMKSCAKYAMKDAERTWLLWKAFYIGILEDKAWDMYALRRKLIKVVYDMQSYGIHIYINKINNLIAHLEFQEKQIIGIMKQTSGYLGILDPNKPDCLSDMLHTYLKIPVTFTTDTGRPSMAEDAIKWYTEHHDHPTLKYLKLWKEISTELRFLRSYKEWGV